MSLSEAIFYPVRYIHRVSDNKLIRYSYYLILVVFVISFFLPTLIAEDKVSLGWTAPLMLANFVWLVLSGDFTGPNNKLLAFLDTMLLLSNFVVILSPWIILRRGEIVQRLYRILGLGLFLPVSVLPFLEDNCYLDLHGFLCSTELELLYGYYVWLATIFLTFVYTLILGDQNNPENVIYKALSNQNRS